jgi:nudix-type nucleoside diphosphatase (YffH/AdpP family)
VTKRISNVAAETLFEGWGRLTGTSFDYQRRDGTVQRLKREVYDHGNAAALLLFDPERKTVLLLRQFRYPPMLNGDDPEMLEVCAGMLDDEAPAAAAARETLEESGHAPKEVTHVCDVYSSPGSLTEKTSLFIGHYGADTRRHEGGGLPDEGEEIELVELPLADALAMIRDGRILDSKTIILLQHLALSRT